MNIRNKFLHVIFFTFALSSCANISDLSKSVSSKDNFSDEISEKSSLEQKSKSSSESNLSSNSSSLNYSSSSSSNVEMDELKQVYSYKAKIDNKLPIVKINTQNLSWATNFNRNSKLNYQINYVSANISTEWEEDTSYNFTNTTASVKVRGNYTLDYPKKSIRIKFDEKQKMFGLNDGDKAKSWILLADWKDLSLQQNSTYFFLGNMLSKRDNLYCTDFRNVELYLNGQYWGMYLLVEQPQVSSHRVNVTEPIGEELDIGYFIEYDGYYDLEDPARGGDYTFTCNYNNNKMHTRSGKFYEPYNIGFTIKSDINSQAQVTQISNYINNVYKIAYEAVNNNTFYQINETYSGLNRAGYANSYDCVSQVINVDSLVDAYILNSIACDDDIASSSFYMSCDLNHNNYKPLTFECPWDKDSAFGIKVHHDAAGDVAGECRNPWLTLFAGVSWFDEKVTTRWEELKKYGVLEESLSNIRTRKEKYKSYYEKNYKKWPSRITQGNFELYSDVNALKSEAEAADYLYNWLEKRYQVMDDLFGIDNSNEFIKNANKYRYEIENATLTGESEIKTGYNSSNNKYVGQISTKPGNNMTLKVNASKECEVYIFIGCSKMSNVATIDQWFDMKINGTKKNLIPSTVPALSQREEEWHTWISIKALHTTLRQGNNTIELLSKSSTLTNVDYIDIYSKHTLQ